MKHKLLGLALAVFMTACSSTTTEKIPDLTKMFPLDLHCFRRAPLPYSFLDTLTAPRPLGEKACFPIGFDVFHTFLKKKNGQKSKHKNFTTIIKPSVGRLAEK